MGYDRAVKMIAVMYQSQHLENRAEKYDIFEQIVNLLFNTGDYVIFLNKSKIDKNYINNRINESFS